MATPEQRSAAARIAVNTSWARTPARRERTQPATKASPVSVEYWENRVRADGIVCEAEIPKAAVNAHRAYMQQMARKSAASRAAKKKARAALIEQAKQPYRSA